MLLEQLVVRGERGLEAGLRVVVEHVFARRQEALHLYTVGSAWFSQEEDLKGRLLPGQFADFAILSEDYFTVPEARIDEIESLLTVVGGRPVFATGAFAALDPGALPPIRPAWSPVANLGGYHRRPRGTPNAP